MGLGKGREDIVCFCLPPEIMSVEFESMPSTGSTERRHTYTSYTHTYLTELKTILNDIDNF